MPRGTLTVQTMDRDGLNVSYTAGDDVNGHEFTNTAQDVFIHVKNDGGSGITVTIPTSKTVDGLAVADKTVSVGAGEHHMIGPFGNSNYGNSTSTVYVDLSDDTSVTLAAIQHGTPG